MKNPREIDLTSDEYLYYSRHLSIPEFGVRAQKKLKGASVAVVGAGGLGAPILQYLAAAGVGTIGIIDFDRVETENLHRQILFGMSDVGSSKSDVAKKRLQQINPHINIRSYKKRLTSENALELLASFDIVADCTDNFPTRYLINDAAVILDKPYVHGSIFRFEGQVSVFNYVDSNGTQGPDYRDLYPEPPPPDLVPDCTEAGVLGVLPGIIGSIQASEIIKIIAGIGNILSGKLLLFDVVNFETRLVNITRQENNSPPVRKLIDYEVFCGFPANGSKKDNREDVPEISVQKYKAMLDRGEEIQLIDVREPGECEIARIGGDGIPLAEICNRSEIIRRDCKVILYCQSGKRSAEAVRRLQKKYGFRNLYSLKGGMLAWMQGTEKPYQKEWE